MMYHFEVPDSWSCDNFVVEANTRKLANVKLKAYLKKNYNKADADSLFKKATLVTETDECISIGQSFD